MPRYKFVAVALKGGDKKDSKVTRSIRSHAIRAGLQKRSKHSEVEKVAPEISAEVRLSLVFLPPDDAADQGLFRIRISSSRRDTA